MLHWWCVLLPPPGVIAVLQQPKKTTIKLSHESGTVKHTYLMTIRLVCFWQSARICGPLHYAFKFRLKFAVFDMPNTFSNWFGVWMIILSVPVYDVIKYQTCNRLVFISTHATLEELNMLPVERFNGQLDWEVLLCGVILNYYYYYYYYDKLS